MNPIDNKFKQKLEGLEIAPSQQVWERIRAEVPHRKKRPYAWMSAAAAIALLISVGLWFGKSPSEEIINLPAKQMPITHSSQESGLRVKQMPEQDMGTFSLAGKVSHTAAATKTSTTQKAAAPSRESALENHELAGTTEDGSAENQNLASVSHFEMEDDDFEIEVILNNPERYLASRRHTQNSAEEIQYNETAPPMGDKLKNYAMNQFNNLRQLQPIESPSEYGLSLSSVKLPFVKVVEE